MKLMTNWNMRNHTKPTIPIHKSEGSSPPDVLTLASVPDYATRGAMRGDGKEWIEFPAGSSNQFFRDPLTGQWTRGK